MRFLYKGARDCVNKRLLSMLLIICLAAVGMPAAAIAGEAEMVSALVTAGATVTAGAPGTAGAMETATAAATAAGVAFAAFAAPAPDETVAPETNGNESESYAAYSFTNIKQVIYYDAAADTITVAEISTADANDVTEISGGDTPLGSAELPEVSPFLDVSTNDWYYKDIIYVFSGSLMVGEYTEPMLFKPEMNLNRGMIVTILYRMDGAPDTSGMINTFGDVAEDAWYAGAVKWAVANGLVEGYGNGLFGPEDPVTREQLAVILYRYTWYAGDVLPSVRGYPGFVDDNAIESYAKDAVEHLYKANIVGGKLGYSFDPKGGATRAETAAMLRRLEEI